MPSMNCRSCNLETEQQKKIATHKMLNCTKDKTTINQESMIHVVTLRIW